MRQLRRERHRRRLATAILVVGLAGAVVSGTVSYRAAGPRGESGASNPRPHRVFDPSAGKVTMVAFAADGSLRIDHWAYMDGVRLLRLDVDEDRDGFVDRREHYGPGGRLERTERVGAWTPGGQPFRPAGTPGGQPFGAVGETGR